MNYKVGIMYPRSNQCSVSAAASAGYKHRENISSGTADQFSYDGVKTLIGDIMGSQPGVTTHFPSGYSGAASPTDGRVRNERAGRNDPQAVSPHQGVTA